LNKFMYAQAVALRDLSKESFKQLEGAYADLSAEEKTNQKINYIDTLLRSNHYDQSLSLLNEMTQTSVDPLYFICLSRAYAGKGDLAKAEEMAKQAIVICDKENSPHSDAYCQLGEVLFAKGDLEGAKKNADAALGINTKAFRAYVLVGNVFMKSNQPKLAVEAANKAIEINPYFIDAYLLLGNAQIAQGDLKGALTSFRKAVDLYPGLIQTHQSLLSVLKKLGSKDEINREQAAIAGLKSKD
jgi:protein O-GlcNAc transferase